MRETDGAGLVPQRSARDDGWLLPNGDDRAPSPTTQRWLRGRVDDLDAKEENMANVHDVAACLLNRLGPIPAGKLHALIY